MGKRGRHAMVKWVRKASKGVTIFEIMIALALFAIIITPVMRSFVTAMAVNKQARETMYATDVANSIMEGISGKTYEEVVKWLGYASAEGGFDITDPTQNKFSSINDDYYNLGHCRAECFANEAPPLKYKGKYSFANSVASVPSDNSMGGFTTSGLDQKMAAEAIFDLSKKDQLPGDDTSDKFLYFGFSYEDLYGASEINGIPKLTYMMYSRIQKHNYYYDAIVTFVPRAQNINLKTGVTSDEYFVYQVTVTVYQYDFNPITNLVENRFDASDKHKFDGAPAAILTGGIQNKDINGEFH